MTADLPAMVLLGLATVIACGASLAVLVMPGFYNKLHYLAPPAILSTTTIAAAILLQEGLGVRAIKSLLVLIVMAVGNPVLTHAVARAGMLRKKRNPEA